jgi:hypothetical protein
MINEFLPRCQTQQIKDWLQTVVAKQLKPRYNQSGEQLPTPEYQDIEHILDYLHSDEAPRRINTRLSYKQAKEQSEAWTKALIKKAADVVETEDDVETVYEEEGFRWVKLVGKNAFEREGNLMRHCVGNYFGKQDTTIYSLRDYKNNPHCTIEYRSSVNQIKGKGNGSIHPKYVKYVLQFLKYLDVPIGSHDLANLGYIDLTDLNWELLEKHKIEHKYMMFNNKKYYYRGV